MSWWSDTRDRDGGGVLTLTIARLTLREASRRRLVRAFLLLTTAAIALTGWGFAELSRISVQGQLVTAVEVRLVAAPLLILVVFMFSFMLVLGAGFMAAPALAGDVESGIALAILARPIRRAELVLGRWLGIGALVAAYAVAASVVELAVVQVTTGYAPPSPAEAIGYLIAESLVLLTLTLLLSARLSAMTAGIVGTISFALAWIGGVIGGIGVAFGDESVAAVGTATRLLLPTDGLWRGALFALEPGYMVAGASQAGPALAAFPFFVPAGPEVAYLAWCAAWVAAMLRLTVLAFERREV